MVSEYSDIKHDYKFSFYISILVIALFVVSGFALTAGGGLQDPSFLQAFIIYSILGGVGVAFNIVVTSYNFMSRRRALKPIVHEPEDGLMSKVKFVRNPWLLFLLTYIIFSVPLFLVGKYQNSFFSGIPFATQQISTFSSVWGDAVFPALAENLFTFILVSLLYTWNFKANYRRSSKVYYWAINIVVIPLVYAGAWTLFHWSRYGSIETALASVFFFSLIGLMFTMATMSAIPYFVMHFLTNFMLSLKKHGLMSNDLSVMLIVLSEIVALVLFAIIYWKNKHSDKVFS